MVSSVYQEQIIGTSGTSRSVYLELNFGTSGTPDSVFRERKSEGNN
jgi:hypothetical protein